ncbi:MAG: LysR family transcriptional regulator [Salinarimonadaceae bacterium]|nr:MAG: LysR family transcriptional regulator [Salinarimonadaceae bacterium]
MDVRWLRYFVAIAEAGSFSKAARHLGVAQPALSRHVREIEEQLGTSALLRTSRGVTLTEDGELLYTSALNILRQLDSLPSIVGRRGGPVTGRVVIGLPTSANVVLALPLLFAVIERLPGVQIHIIESLSGFLREWVQTGRLDLAVLYDAETSSSLFVERLVEEELCLVGAPHACASLTPEIRLADVARLPLVLPGLPHSMRQLVNEVSIQHNVALDIIAEADSLHILKAVAASGKAFTILARSAARAELDAGTLDAVRVTDPPLRRSVSLARPLLRGSNPAVQEVARLCLDLAAELAREGSWG